MFIGSIPTNDRRREAYPVLQRHGLCLCGIHVANPGTEAAEEGNNNNSGSTWGSLQTGCHPPLSAYPHTGCDWGVYLRFHGDHSRGSYGADALEPWAASIWRWRREGLPANAPPRRVFAFFNNDASQDEWEPGLPSAVADAHRLGELLVRRLEEEAETEAAEEAAEDGAATKKAAAVAAVVKPEQP